MSLNLRLRQYLILNIILLIATFRIYSQKDSVWVTLTYAAGITDGIKDPQEKITSQKTYTLDWNPIRELKFDFQSGQLDSYIVYFYDDKDRVSSIEEFSMEDSLINGRKYNYDEQNRINEIRYYLSGSSSMPILEKREVLLYNSDTLMKSVVAYNSAGKKINSAVYRYDPENRVNLVERKFRKAPDGISKSSEQDLLDKLGRVVDRNETIRYKDGSTIETSTKYKYDDQGKIESVNKYTEGQINAVINYKYFANNRLLSVEERDKDEVLVSYRHFDYQIFYINRGTNKSLLE